MAYVNSVLDSFCVDISVSTNSAVFVDSTVCPLCNKQKTVKNLKDLQIKKSLEVDGAAAKEATL